MRAIALFTALLLAAGTTACGSGNGTTTRDRPPPKPLAVYAAGKLIETLRPPQRRFHLPATIRV
jgi:hypothetical protein